MLRAFWKRQSQVLRQATLAAGLFCLTAAPGWARDWYSPAHAGRSYVNPFLTVERARGDNPSPNWQGQLVLWEGQLVEQKKIGPQLQLRLKSGNELINVECPSVPLTLGVDRSGCQVAIKGEVQLKDGKFDRLIGRSVILLGPPKPWPTNQRLEQFLGWWIHFHSPQYAAPQCLKLGQQMIAEAEKNQIDPLFFASLLQVESAYKCDAVSCSGAVGLGQLMPTTAEGLGVDPWDPLQNLTGSARMLSGLLKNFPEQTDPRALALASYNAGPNLVRGLGQVPRIPQTTNYVYFIGYLHHRLQQVARAQGALPETAGL